MRQAPQLFLLLATALVVTAPASAQQSALTVPRNLDQLTDRAAVIFRGNVVSAQVEKHPEFQSLHTVVVTMRVREMLKGEPRSTYTFRQYIWDIRDRLNAAGYRKGQDMLLMMIAPSAAGLSSPAGYDQGRFRIRRDADGREVAANGHGNFRLFHGLAADAAKKGTLLSPSSVRLAETHQSGPIPVAELSRLIRELAVGNR
ncbi:MAG TPA: hypothetical protein VML92_08300 [Steroidobacteraceae bacterium]|nr:hypothetical protein [Steroidobacteraceae bacterium]